MKKFDESLNFLEKAIEIQPLEPLYYIKKGFDKYLQYL